MLLAVTCIFIKHQKWFRNQQIKIFSDSYIDMENAILWKQHQER